MILRQHIKVTESARTMRAMARQMLRNRWTEALLVMLFVYAVLNVPAMVVLALSDSQGALMVTNLYTLLLSGPLTLGTSVYFLKVCRHTPGGIEDVIQAVRGGGRAISLYMLLSIRVFFLSLLFVIPGIWAALRYSQAFYILADSPEKKARQCLWESSLLMRGNLLRLLALQLSFIGWMLLAVIPPALFQARLGIGSISQVLSSSYGWREVLSMGVGGFAEPISPLVFLLGLGTILVNIYLSMASTCFYELVSGSLIVQQADDIHG